MSKRNYWVINIMPNYRLVPKMASSVDVVMQFLNELAQRAKPAAKKT
jgi:Zn-dependent oligopeptidase